MADRFYGIDLGKQQPSDVSESSSTTAKAIELRVNDTVYSSPLLVQLALEAVKNYLQSKESHPIG